MSATVGLTYVLQIAGRTEHAIAKLDADELGFYFLSSPLFVGVHGVFKKADVTLLLEVPAYSREETEWVYVPRALKAGKPF